MPTTPPAGLFHTPDSRDAALVNAASRVLGEVVNFGLVTFQRVVALPAPKEHQLAVLFLYRQVFDLIDGFHVLIRQLASGPGRLQLRGVFEALVSLEYITKEDSERRGFAYLVGDTLGQLSYWGRIAEGEREPHLPSTFWGMMKVLRNRLLRPGWAEAHEAFIEERARQRRKPGARWWPAWYSLYGGPSDLAGLAARCSRTSDYDELYRHWSNATHATDVTWQMTPESGIRPLRSPILLGAATALAVQYAVDTLKRTLTFYAVPDGERAVQLWIGAEGIARGLEEIERVTPPLAPTTEDSA